MSAESQASSALEKATSVRVRQLLDDAAACRDNDPGASRQFALQARVVARADGDRVGEAEALYRLASLAHGAGDADEAFGLAMEASEIASTTSATLIEAWAVHLIGIVHYQASNFSEALEHCLRALEIYRTTDHQVDEGNILNTVAAVYHSMGDNDRAIVTYESALAVNEPLGRFGFAALVLGNIARIRASRSEYLPAVSLGRRAVDLARKHSPDIVSNLLADLAEAYMGLADHERASECFAEARRVWEERADHGIEPVPATQLGVMMAEGRVALRRGALSEAISVLQAALDMAERTDSREFELEINDLLATAFKRSGRFEEALDRREKHDSQYRTMFTHATDLRLRTLQVAHETATARQQAEILRLRTHELEAMVTTDGQPIVRSANQLDAFERLAVLAEFRDTDTGQHTKRVGDMAAEIAHARGENPDWAERLRLAARLHDIGKVSVPDAVLLKSGPLTVEEFEIMKTHTTVGNQILAGSSSPLFQLASEIAISHHEWWDGSGYPYGHRAESIALSGRIVALADVFDALCSRRAYKRAWPMGEAARFIVSGRGAQFEPDLVDSFVSVLLARYPELEGELG
ncbi:MAG TPA: HD domain-containing phosphohydrolase [Ilumatobacteraceae bacterium]|nr:HD domain-containing phosphohydrolase [Ilumatobacteraceae bacterium]